MMALIPLLASAGLAAVPMAFPGADWVDAATSVQVPADLPLHPSSGADGRGVYGFNWWVNGIKADGTRKFPDAPVGTFQASGANNNDLFVIPEWRMVVVRLGLDEFNDGKITDDTYSTWLGRIGAAIREGWVCQDFSCAGRRGASSGISGPATSPSTSAA